MKLASFFIISIAFHTAILVLPVSFLKTDGEEMIPVVLLGGNGGDGEGSSGMVGMERKVTEAAPTARQHHPGASGREMQRFSRTGDMEETAKVENPVPSITPESNGEGLMVAGLKGDKEGRGFSIGGAGERGGGVESGGSGNSQAGTGPGGGSGGGGGLAGSGFARAGYAYNPKPKYPETARQEGWEGTVLLRVLVDREGISKSIEVSRSSGFETLDRAAMETVKSWRFHPAHYGERRVESWVRIPIVFSLADLKN